MLGLDNVLNKNAASSPLKGAPYVSQRDLRIPPRPAEGEPYPGTGERRWADGTPDKAQVAVYDFDGTIIDGDSPVLLVRELMLTRQITPLTSLKIGLWAAAYKMRLPHNESWVRGQVFKGFEGWKVEDADNYLAQFYDQRIAQRSRAAAIDSMRRRKQEGCVIAVVSATFEPIVVRAMDTWPIDIEACTRMKVTAEGTYACEVEGLPVEGDEKPRALKRLCDGRFGEGEWELAYAYGDHHSDAPLLAAARHAYAVDPDTTLKRQAEQRGWAALDW